MAVVESKRAAERAGDCRGLRVRLTWLEPDPPRTLPPWEVHVWSVQVALAAPPLPAQELALSSDERRRADLYRRAEDRARFVACRGALRERLASYTGIPAAEQRIAEGAGGKPVLQEGAGAAIRFSISHSGGLGLLAFAAGGSVGIDVERIRARPSLARLAGRFFSADEREAVLGSPDPAGTFSGLWTLKEAALKATGEGLAGLERVRVALGSDGPAVWVAPPGGGSERRWEARAFVPAPGYVGAVVFTA